MKLPEPLSISNDVFHPLEVELMNFRYMPGKHAVSLVYPGGEIRGRTRIINLAPQTALNLLAWLEQWRETLQQLANEESTNVSNKSEQAE